jgi:hypothetical protein
MFVILMLVEIMLFVLLKIIKQLANVHQDTEEIHYLMLNVYQVECVIQILVIPLLFVSHQEYLVTSASVLQA